MRRTLAVVACLVAIVGLLAPAAFAQAPAPKVTIVGLFDQVTSAGKNIYDGDFSRTKDAEWYARTRFRPDFTFEVGRSKAVLGLEMDLQYGGCGVTGGDGSFGTGTAAGCKPASNGGLDTNTDVAGIIEIKWVYTEFDLTGKDSLLPFIPVSTVARLGGQPYATLANYKVVYANGDFAGFSGVTTFTPNIKTNIAYVMVEDENASNQRLVGKLAGEDFAFIFSPEITPIKGLDIKPLYSYFQAAAGTSGSARRTVLDTNIAGTGSTQGAAATSIGSIENRHTIGVDVRFRSGPFSLDPTFYYQFGNRDFNRSAAAGGGSHEADISTWIADVQGGWQLGPLLLEARGMWTRGNKATDDITSKVKYFEPINLDTGYWAGWAAIFALGVDYFNGGGGANGQMASNIGYDRYGRRALALRATYSLTPQLAFYGIVTPNWTDQKVDTDTTIAGANAAAGQRQAPTSSGDSRYLGTEADVGLTWRFAPNTVFDLQGAYLFAGKALDSVRTVNGVVTKFDAEDGWTIAARVRLSF